MGSEEASRAEPRALSAATLGLEGGGGLRGGWGTAKGTRGVSRVNLAAQRGGHRRGSRDKGVDGLYRWSGVALDEPAFTSP